MVSSILLESVNKPTTTMSTTAPHKFTIPRKVILLKEQLEHFQASKAHQDIIAYIQTLNEAIVGVKLTDDCPESPVRECRTICVSEC